MASIFAEFDQEIRDKLTKIKQPGKKMVVDESQEYYTPAEYSQGYYLDLLIYLQLMKVHVLMNELHEVGSDPDFQRFVQVSYVTWEDVAEKLEAKYDKDVLELAVFFAYDLHLSPASFLVEFSPVEDET